MIVLAVRTLFFLSLPSLRAGTNTNHCDVRPARVIIIRQKLFFQLDAIMLYLVLYNRRVLRLFIVKRDRLGQLRYVSYDKITC